MKSTVKIDKVEGGKVEFTVSLEAKQDIEVYGLRAFYYDKTKRREYSGVGNSKRTTLDSDEIGDLDLLDGKLAMKAGEKKEISAYFELTKIISSHYIEISGKLDSPCPPEMDVIPCMEKQKADAEKDPKSREIYMLQRILEKEEK